MDQCHAYQNRDVAGERDFVFEEELFRTDVAAADPEDYDDASEDGAPPADEEGRLVFAEEAVWWGWGVE